MSRPVTDAFKAAAFAQETGEVVVTLLTITHPDMEETIRISSDPTQRLDGSGDPQPIYGTISRGEQYLFVPFDLTLPDEQDETAPNAKIRLSNVGREVMELVRSVDTPAKIVLEILLGSDLETVEVAFPELHIAQAEYTAGELTLGLVVDFLSEIPFPGGTFGPAYFPGLFG